MRYNNLGPTGVLVSELCLGTMTFGEAWGFGGIDDIGADAILGASLDAGINFVDTADVYSEGNSESILGRALAKGGRRERIVLATKAFGRTGPGRNDTGLSRLHLVRACEASLKRLGTDRIDLYQIHGFDAETPIEEVVRGLDVLVKSGKVLYVGLCNLAAWQIALALGEAKAHDLERFVSAQMFYSLAGRDVEHEVVPLCLNQKLALLPWSPLAGGFLSGKYRRDDPKPEGSRFATSKFGEFPPIDKDQGFKVVDKLVEIAARLNTTPTTLAIKWLLTRPAVTSVIIGIRRLDQLAANVAATEIEVPAEDLAAIDELSKPKELYPNWMIRFQRRNRIIS
jgi:aryl-alcohol dehydrogenase-like predicted oxidoreductase